MTINFDFNSLKEKAKDLAQTGVAKAKELSDTAIGKGKELGEIGKLKVQNASEQDAIKKAYLELGKLYFAERGAAPEAAYAARGETARKALGAADAAMQQIGAQVNPKIVLSVLAAKFRTF